MPTQLWRTTHTNNDDFLLGGAGATTLNGDLGNDLILGDSITPFTFGSTNSLASPANIDSPSHWTTEENPLVADTSIPYTSLYIQPEAGGMQYSSVTVGDGESINIEIDFGAFSPVGGGASYLNTFVIIELLDSSDAVVATGTYSYDPGSSDPGSVIYDEYLSYINSTGSSQVYTIRFSEYDGWDGSADGGVFEGDETFIAQVSVSGHAASAPTSAGNDTLYGGGGDDWLIGQGGNDALHGGAGDDNLFGGSGNDLIDGGDSIDTAWYNDATRGVFVSLSQSGPQNTGGAGIDTLVSIESLRGSSFNDTLIGDDGYNLLWGGAGNDTILGGNGTNFLYGEDGADTLIGGNDSDFITADRGDASIWFNNVLVGQGGNDWLYGWYGNDQLSAGDGDDNIEEVGGNDVVDGGAGSDTLIFWNIGNPLTINLSNTGAQAIGIGNYRISGIENIIGSQGADTLTGDSHANRLNGYYRNDTLYGMGGDDILIGGSDDDLIDGGSGSDSASYEDMYAGVSVSLAIAGAQDTISGGMDTLISIENLIGSYYADFLYGNGIANTLTGGNGNDTLEGRGGNDTLIGGDGDDILVGGAGNDLLNGGVGIDTASYADSHVAVTVSLAVSGAQDTGGSGMDTLNGIEDLIGTSHDDSLTGNGADNYLDGGKGGDLLSGGGGNDVLQGRGGNDVLQGGQGNDRLEGGRGNDTMSGGAGNDVYVVDSSGDSVTEASDQGTDTVLSSISYSLGANVERLTLTGTASISAHGNTLDNVIRGNDYDNVISGDRGNDTLTGGLGADTFRFNTTLNASTNVDTITDFGVGVDHIDLDDDIFTAVGAVGTLSAGAFYVGSAAHDGSDRIIYDPTTGNLYYDADGNGAGAAILFAKLDPMLMLQNTDFQIIG